MKNVVCIVQARIGSERLPGKVMKEVKGKPLISYTLDRLKESKYLSDIVLATSTASENDDMVSYASNRGYNVFRGSENNVLERYLDAAEKYSADIVVRVTGDCPLIDPVIVDSAICKLIYLNYDYVRLDVPNTFIRGFDVEVFTMDALKRVENLVEKNQSTNYDRYREHVTLYIYEHPEIFSVGYIKGDKIFNKDYRLCVDTIEDFNLVKKVVESGIDLNAFSIVEFLDINDRIVRINDSIRQKNV